MSKKPTSHLKKSEILQRFGKESKSPDVLSNSLLEGNIAALSTAITLSESTLDNKQKLAQEILNNLDKTEKSTWRIGISGVPGVGKSTFIESFGNLLIEKGKKVAVLAVDPSSSLNKGSILGDKTRMEKLVQSDKAYIRPSPSSSNLGGVSSRTKDAITLCEAAGFDIIIIETVGVGQSETAVANLVDFFLLLKIPGAGDELQGIKRGILELCDTIVINKSDLGSGELAKRTFENSLHLLQLKEDFWIPSVHLVSSLKNEGLEEVYQQLVSYFSKSIENDNFTKKRAYQNRQFLNQEFEQNLMKLVKNDNRVQELQSQLQDGILGLREVKKLLKDYLDKK
jgi:LAO/AO transport system kinase